MQVAPTRRASGRAGPSVRAAVLALLFAAFALFALSLPTLTHAQATTDSVPPNAEPECRTFLTTLKEDDKLDACMKPLMNATALYQNGSQSVDAANQLAPTLQQLCGAASACDLMAIRSTLTDFWANCRNDIVNQVTGVYNTYDFLYILTPFKSAICSQDGQKNYCLLNVAKAASQSKSKRSDVTDDEDADDVDVTPRPPFAQDTGADSEDDDDDDEDANDIDVTPTSEEARLQRRQRDQYHAALAARMRKQSTLLRRQSTDEDPDPIAEAGDINNGTDTNNVAFLFVKPDASKEVLCSECVQNILAGYINFEVSLPYAVGLSASLFLRGQSALYKSAEEQCGKDFTRQANIIAGTEAFQDVGAASRRASGYAGTLSAAIVVAGSVAVAMAL